MIDSKAVLVIYTGGTIGMILEKESGALQPFDFGQLYDQIPSLRSFDFSIDCLSFDQIMDSSDVGPETWVKIARIVEENYEKYEGFVVLHGSDTMAYSASALSFMLENLNKPVVFTGSQLPLGVVRTDGRENLVAAIEIASALEDDTPMVPEVCIYFENQLLRGNRTFKYNAEHFEAFRSVNYPALANAGVYIKYDKNYILKPNFRKLKVHTNLDTHIAILKLFPGINESTVKAILNAEGLKAVVFETYGSGNAPTEPWLIEALDKAIKKGLIIFNVTQCKGGSVEMGKYETSIELKKIGILGGFDITTESAVTKLMYLLGRNFDRENLIRLLQTPLRGEMSITRE